MKRNGLNRIATSKQNKDWRKRVVAEIKDLNKALKGRAKFGNYNFSYEIDLYSWHGWDRYQAYRLFRYQNQEFTYTTRYTGIVSEANMLKKGDFVNHHKAEKVLINISWK